MIPFVRPRFKPLPVLFVVWVAISTSSAEEPDWETLGAQAHPLDLETRSLLAIRAMQNTIQPELRVPFIMAYLSPDFRLDAPTSMLSGEFLDGLIMARTVTGSMLGKNVESEMQHAATNAFVDGLADGTIIGAFGTDKKTAARTVELAGHKHLLPSLLTLRRLDPKASRPLDLVKESLQTFRRIAVKKRLPDRRPYLYYPVARTVPNPGMFSYIGYDRKLGWKDHDLEPIETGSAGFQGAVILPFSQYYQLTRDPSAADFLDRFIRFVRERATDFNRDGSFTKRDVTNGQVWSRLMTTEGILIYGLTSRRKELIDWAQSVFDKLTELHATRFGWFPENLAFNHGLGCETDAMTAYLEIAFLLARFVDDSYWETVERIAMNQLLEQQILDVRPLGNAAVLLGGFASFASPHDWFTPKGPYLTQSCHGSGARSLYNVWYHIAWWEKGPELPILRVNLHWSKNLPGARVISHLPASTKLTIHVERPCQLIVRKPDWAEPGEIEAVTMSAGKERKLPVRVEGRWLHVGRFLEPAEVHIRMPDEVVSHTDVIHDHAEEKDVRFTTRWRGNAVLSIKPSGTRRPNYARRERQKWAPYVPRHTATTAFDPITMTPPHATAEPRLP